MINRYLEKKSLKMPLERPFSRSNIPIRPTKSLTSANIISNKRLCVLRSQPKTCPDIKLKAKLTPKKKISCRNLVMEEERSENNNLKVQPVEQETQNGNNQKKTPIERFCHQFKKEKLVIENQNLQSRSSFKKKDEKIEKVESQKVTDKNEINKKSTKDDGGGCETPVKYISEAILSITESTPTFTPPRSMSSPRLGSDSPFKRGSTPSYIKRQSIERRAIHRKQNSIRKQPSRLNDGKKGDFVELQQTCMVDRSSVEPPKPEEDLKEDLDTVLPCTWTLLEEIERELPPSSSLTKVLDYSPHSVTKYRTLSRLTRLNMPPIKEDKTLPTNSEKLEDAQKCTSEKERLENEKGTILMIKAQVEKAVTLSRMSKDQDATYLESEKSLLLTHLRLNAIEKQLEALKHEKIVSETRNELINCCLILSSINLTIKSSIQFEDIGNIILTGTIKDTVVDTISCYPIEDGRVPFEKSFTFFRLDSNFQLHLQLFCLNKPEITKQKKFNKKVHKIMQKLSSNRTRHMSLTDETPMEHDFQFIGDSVVGLEDLKKSNPCKLVLKNVANHISELTLHFTVKIEVISCTTHSGFLNVMKTNAELPNWSRRWIVQSNFFLRCWNYPGEQDSDKPPIEEFNLLHFIADSVKPASLEDCIRPNTFVVKYFGAPLCVSTMLFNADSQKEMQDWCERLNTLTNAYFLWRVPE